MIQSDTIKLLRECDAGIKMGMSSIDEVIDKVKDENFKGRLADCRSEHNKLKEEIQTMLDEYQDEGKNPPAMIQGMSWVKTNVMLAMEKDDSTVADLMTDGCNMGVKSLNRYLNEYKAAEERAKDITKRLIQLEEQLTIDMRQYL